MQELFLRLVGNAARVLQAVRRTRIQPFKKMHSPPCDSIPAARQGRCCIDVHNPQNRDYCCGFSKFLFWLLPLLDCDCRAKARSWSQHGTLCLLSRSSLASGPLHSTISIVERKLYSSVGGSPRSDIQSHASTPDLGTGGERQISMH